MRCAGTSPLLRPLGEQSGFTLVEMLIASAMLAAVLGGIFSILETSQGVFVRDQERANQVKEAEMGVYQMTRELRQSYSLIATGPYSFEGNVYENGQSLHVRYDCTGASAVNSSWGKCVRNLIGTTTSSTTVLPSFTNTSASGGKPIFTYTTNGSGTITYAAVHVEVPAQGALKHGHSYRITYDDGFYMRNLG